MSPRPLSRTSRSDLRERIIDAAWQQIALEGAPALSLRAIARALKIAAPSIYNYFPNRDALVTALVVEAYTLFGDAQHNAQQAAPTEDLPGQLRAIGNAYRDWANKYPERYQLIFGTPIPGYVAPREQTLPAAECAISPLVSVIAALHQNGRLKSYPPVQDEEMNCLAIAVLIWSRVHGFVSLEIAGSLPPFGMDPAQLYQYELDAILTQFHSSNETVSRKVSGE
jgi:AcrR family transcriptional regulator